MQAEAELLQVMKRCSSEIKQLRAQIAHLQPKADAYDNLATVLSMVPRPPQGYGEDLAWQLDHRIKELMNTPKSKETTDA